MTVRLALVRVNAVDQVSPIRGDSACRKYAYFQAFFVGYTGGARSRMKSFKTQFAVLCYLNKLRSGGWMDDHDYDQAWDATMELSSCAILLGIDYPN